MTIKQRGAKKIWQIELAKPDGTMLRMSCKTTDKKEAQRMHDDIKAQMRLGVSLMATPLDRSQALTLQQGFNRAWKEEWKRQRSSKTTEYNFKRVLKYIAGETLLEDISLAMLKDLVNDFRDDELSNASINRSLSVLSKILTMARDEWEVINKAPKIPVQSEGAGRLRWLQDGEEELILTFFNLQRIPDMPELVPVYLDTGCRRNEILNLEKWHFLEEQRAIQLLNAKTSVFDVQPLTDRAFRILKARAEGLKNRDDKLFQVSPRAVSERFLRMRGEVFPWDEELCVHSLRHTTASRLVLAGVDLKRVQQFMRHESIETTLRYAKLKNEAKEDSVRVLEGLTNKPPKEQRVVAPV